MQSNTHVAFPCNVTSRTTRRAFIGRSKICMLPTCSFSSSLRKSKGSPATRKIHKEKMKISNIVIAKGLRPERSEWKTCLLNIVNKRPWEC